MAYVAATWNGPDDAADRNLFWSGHASPAARSTAPKIFLRALLVATSKRGLVIEAMHASLTRNESHQNFNIWVYGDDKLVRGSGLFIGETGLATNHHFLTPREDSAFKFLPGIYYLKIYAQLLGSSRRELLFNQELVVSPELAQALRAPGNGLYFDWGPESSRYLPHVEERPPLPDPAQFFERLGLRSSSKPDEQ